MNKRIAGWIKSPEKAAFLLVTTLGVIFRVWASAPTWMHYDENYYLNIAQSYAIRGELTPYLWRLGDTSIVAGGGSGYGILLLNFWLNLVQNSLFWGRMLMVACGLLSALVMYFVAKAWWNSKIAGVAAFLLAIASTSSFYALILKMDALAILTYCLVLLLYTVAERSDKPFVHAGVGVAAILTVEFHSLGILYVFALACLYLYEQVSGMLEQKKWVINRAGLAFAAGAFVTGIVYLLMHVLPDTDAYFVISRQCFECNEPILATELKRLVRLLILRPHEILLLVLVGLGLLRVKSKESRRFLVLMAGWVLAQALFGSPPYVHYTNHFWPVLALGVGGWFACAPSVQKIRQRIPLGYALALVSLLLNLDLHLSGNHPYLLAYPLKTSPAVQYVLENIETDTVVMGNIPTYYPLRNYSSYLAYRDGCEYGAYLRGESMLDFWRRVQPQVLILDEEKYVEDGELKTYLNENKFVNVMPELWLAPVLVK